MTVVLFSCIVFDVWAIYARARTRAHVHAVGAARVTAVHDDKHGNAHARKCAHDWSHAVA